MDQMVSLWILVLIFILAIWDLVWKAIGLWRSAQNKQLSWFICILIFNTLGILPIIYIHFFQDESQRKN